MSNNIKYIKKGYNPWNKGKKMSKKTKDKISNIMKENLPKYSFKKGCTPWNKGKKGYSIFPNGRKFTKKHKENMSNAQKGEKSYNWKGGITSSNKLLRNCAKWQIWRNFVFLRDNFTCQNPNCEFCKNKVGVILHPHHKKPVVLYPELIFRIDNGITYCAEFHLKSGLHKGILRKVNYGK